MILFTYYPNWQISGVTRIRGDDSILGVEPKDLIRLWSSRIHDRQKLLFSLVYCNKDYVNFFLKEVLKEYKDDYILLSFDGARWHRSKGLEIQKIYYQHIFHLNTIEMNPIEQIWKQIRTMGFRN